MAGTPFQKLEKKRTSFLERSNSFIGDASSSFSPSTSTSTAAAGGGGDKSFPSPASTPRSGSSGGGGSFARVDACVIVDPFSTGAHLAKKVLLLLHIHILLLTLILLFYFISFYFNISIFLIRKPHEADLVLLTPKLCICIYV